MNFLPINKKRFAFDVIIAGGIVILALLGYVTGKAQEIAENLTNQTASVITEEPITMNNAIIETNLGEIEIELLSDKAPKTVDNFIKLAESGFFNGTKIHRVIPDFMIQGGDPLSKDPDWTKHGTGGPGYTFEDESNDVALVRGVVAMANSGPNTNGSQFFIITKQETPWLQGKHTGFAKVVQGMDIVDKISQVTRNENDHPLQDIVVLKVTLK